MLCGALYPAVLVMGEGGPRTARPIWLDESAEVCMPLSCIMIARVASNGLHLRHCSVVCLRSV